MEWTLDFISEEDCTVKVPHDTVLEELKRIYAYAKELKKAEGMKKI